MKQLEKVELAGDGRAGGGPGSGPRHVGAALGPFMSAAHTRAGASCTVEAHD